MLGEGFPGEVPAGAALLAYKVRAALNIRFRSGVQPGVVFVDTGAGFRDPRTGRITRDFQEALSANSLTTFYGDDASEQPGNLQEVLLHETAVSWVRRREATTRPATPWKETVEEFGIAAKVCVGNRYQQP